jgi:hypothetical protein
VETLRFEVVAQARLALGRVVSFNDFARGGHEPTAKFHAKSLKL